MVVEEQTGEADQVPERRPQVVGHRIEQGLDLGGRCPEGHASLRQPPLQLAGLARELLPETGVLNGDGQWSGNLERDIPVLGIERAAGADAARLISPITSPSTMSGEDRTDRSPSAWSCRRRGGGSFIAARSSM